MAVTMRFGKLPVENVAFAYSPGQEVLHSLHVLADSRSHPLHIPWVVRVRKQLSPLLKAEFEHFEELFGNRLPVLWDVRESRSLRTFEQDLVELRDCGRDHEYPFDLQRFCRFLEGFWNACLAEQWEEIEAMFAADIERRGRLLLRRGLAGALQEIAPDARVDAATATCVISRSFTEELVLTETDHLTLTPTYFAWPHMFIHPHRPHPMMAYPVLDHQLEGRAPVPPDRLLKLLRAAGDMSRLQILQLVGARPRTTGELAGLIGISEAAVSKHLKQLQEAGLVAAERQSYYVFYRAVREPVRELYRGLDAMLSEDGAGSAPESPSR